MSFQTSNSSSLPVTTTTSSACCTPAARRPDEAQREAIAEAAQKLDELRRNWLNPPDASEAVLKKRTLTNLYNERPTWLANAHLALDRAVWAAYGWPESPEATDDETILSRLLALNLERANAGDPLPE
jgi:hypothetical protein